MTRRSKFVLLAFGPVVVSAIVCLFVMQAGIAAQADVDARVAALKAAGEPTSLQDLAAKPPLPDENAATYLRRARVAMESIDKEYTAAYENLSPEQRTASDIGRPPAEFVSSLREALNAYPEAGQLVDQAVAAPAYDSQLDCSKDPVAFFDDLEEQTWEINRRAMRLLNYRTTVQLADGNLEGALATTIQALKLCRHFDNEPTLLGTLVAFAGRGSALGQADLVMRAGPISDSLRKQLDEELARSNMVEIYQRGLLKERALGLEVIREMESGKLELNPDERWIMQMPAAFAKHQARYLDFMAEAIALAARPFSDVKDNPKLAESLDGVDPSAKVVMPSITAAHAAMCRAIVFSRSVQILNAIQRFERDHPCKEPALADLGLTVEMTTDPFNGQPLHLIRTPQGWSIYSVDMNLIDDGGREFPLDSGLLVHRISAEAEASK